MSSWHPGHTRHSLPSATAYDAILMLPPDHANLRKILAARGQQQTIIVGGLNVGYGHHKERLRMCRTGADHIVINNRDCWERLGRLEGTSWISNGVEFDTFHVAQPIETRKQRVLWTGCEFHCKGPENRGTNIKGWNEILVPLAERFKQADVLFEFRRVNSENHALCYTTEQMVEWYNAGTIYICTSSSEGTPNPAIEAAACGCVVVSTRVGNMPELIEPYVNGELVDRDVDSVDSFFDAIVRCQNRYVEMATAMQERIVDWDWRLRATEYFDLFRRLIDARRDQQPCRKVS